MNRNTAAKSVNHCLTEGGGWSSRISLAASRRTYCEYHYVHEILLPHYILVNLIKVLFSMMHDPMGLLLFLK